MRKKHLINEDYDPRDEEYVSEFEESPEDEFDLEEDGQKYIIIGTSEWGEEVLDYANDEDEAEMITKKYQISFGDQWDINYMLQSEYDFDKSEIIENEDFDDEGVPNVEDYDNEDNDIPDIEDKEDYWVDPDKDLNEDEEDPEKIYESIIMKPLR
jgi:hypothetical protein